MPRSPAPRSSAKMPAIRCSAGVRGTPPVLRGRSGRRRASPLRSTLPLAVRGRAGRETQADGTMNSGSRRRRKSRSSDGSGAASGSAAPAAVAAPGAATTYATSRCPPASSRCASTTALLSRGWAVRAVSISPGSTRKPLTLTCASIRPRNSRSPDRRQRTRSPVLYRRPPASLPEGSGRKRSAVRSG